MRIRLTIFRTAAIYLGLAGLVAQAPGQTKPQTTTSLAMTANGSAASTVPSSTVVTLTATVTAGGSPVSPGEVRFCDASISYCTDVHSVGSAQLRSDGTAVWRFRPGAGTHSYKAVFTGTNTRAASFSAAATLTVTTSARQSPSTALVSSTGSWGSYSVTTSVTDIGATAPLTGTVSYQDTSSGNAVLSTAPLGTSTPGLFWSVQSPLDGTPMSPTSIISADFNGDGIPDVATADSRFQTVKVFTCDATKVCKQTFTTSSVNTPGGLIVADFNSDGILDLAVPSASSTGLTILLGKGDGTFTQSTMSLGIYPMQAVAADFNGDGIPDLAVTSWTAAPVILLGNGDGTFTTGASIPVSGSQAIVAGDFNGDGKCDLAVSVSTGITLFAGNGDGTFTQGSTFQLPNDLFLWRLAAGDFNSDGKLDLALTMGVNVVPTPGKLMVLLNNGDGTFSAGAPFATPNAPAQVQVADFNLDGIPDVAAIDITGVITVYLGRGDGTFSSSYSLPVTSMFSQQFGLGDMDGDGRPDLIASGDAPNNYIFLYFLLTAPTETASTAPAAITLSGTGTHLVTANYTGDATSAPATSSPITLWGTPPATATSLALTANGSAASAVPAGTVITLTASVASGGSALTAGKVNFCDAQAPACSDIHLLGSSELANNGTAVLKLVPGAGNHIYKAMLVQSGYAASSQSGAVTLTVTSPSVSQVQTTTSIAQSGSAGNYTLTATVSEVGSTTAPTGTVSFLDTSYTDKSLATAQLSNPTAGFAFPISYQYPLSNVGYMLQAAGDFNGDGRQDIAAINSNALAVDILISNGDGTFSNASPIALSSYPYAIATGDFNRDGKLDFAVLCFGTFSSPVTASIFLGNGDGTFTPSPTPATFTGWPVSLFVADVNGDGNPDLLVNANGTTLMLLGKGDGTFANPVTIGSSGVIAVGDLNGDAIPDLILGYNSASPVVYLGKGDGTFAASGYTFPNISGAGATLIADFNGDGIPDVAIAGLYYSAVHIYLGKGDGTFDAVDASANPAIDEPQAMALGDLNGDGKPDLIVTNVNAYQGNSMNPDLTFMLGNGDGTFTTIPGDTQMQGTWSVVAADFNGDGRPDLSVGSGTGISVLLTQPSQTVSATATGVAPTGPAPHLVNASYAGDPNFKPSVSDTTSLLVNAPAPVITPAGGTYTSIQSVTITDDIPGATIYYTTDGSTPITNPASFQTASPIYTGPITVSSRTEIISAVAVATGYQQSVMAVATYTLNLTPPAAPELSLASGYYATARTLTITEATPGATVYYTTDGTPPTAKSSQYTGPILVSASQTLKAIAFYGYAASNPATAQYFIGDAKSSFIYTVAGNDIAGYKGDNGPATAASLNYSGAVVPDSAGNLFIADTANNVVRRVDAKTGVITTIAGDGTRAVGGDNGPATQAQLGYPTRLAFDVQGNLYVSEASFGLVRKIAAGTGVITTYAGNPAATTPGDNGPATSAQLTYPQGLAFDAAGNLYIGCDAGVRRVDAVSGTITTFAGNGIYGYSGDNGPAAQASFEEASGLAFDAAGSLYIADRNAAVVRKVAAGTGIVTRVAGMYTTTAQTGFSGDGGPATGARLNYPSDVALDATGNLYIADAFNNAIRVVNTQTGIINTLAGNPDTNCSLTTGDGGTTAAAALCMPISLSINSTGDLYIADQGASRIRLITAAKLPPSTATAPPAFSVASGNYSRPQNVGITDSTPGAAIYISLDGAPSGSFNPYQGTIAVTGSATIQASAVAPGYLPSSTASAAYIITNTPPAVITTTAGIGLMAATRTAGPAATTPIGSVTWVKSDTSGNLYFTSGDDLVRKLDHSTGQIGIIAGGGAYGTPCNGGPSTAQFLSVAGALAIDAKGNIYVVLPIFYYSRVCRIDAVTGNMTTVAGGNSCCNMGDGGPATASYLSHPQGLALDNAGNLYIADQYAGRVRRVDATSGLISTVAGGGNAFPGDGGPATAAQLHSPVDLAFDKAGNLYIAELSGRVRMVSASSGIISTIAGNGNPGVGEDGPAATKTEIIPAAMALDPAGNIYISNTPGTVRRIAASGGAITTIAGSGYVGFSGDGGAATMAELYDPAGLTFDGAANLFIADELNGRIRQVSFQPAVAAPAFSLAAGTYKGTQPLTITDTTPNARIYYTTDGTTPDTTSILYAGAISVATSQTIQAIAVADGYADSPVTSATYTIKDARKPTITWAAPQAITYGTPLSATQLNATADVPGTFAYAPAAGAVLPAGANTLTATFTPADPAKYDAISAQVTLNVSQAAPSITWATPAPINYGTALSVAQLNATASVPGTFVYSPAAGTVPPVGSNSLSVTFTPADTANYTTVNASVTLVVNAFNPVPGISSLTPAIATASGGPFTLTVNGSEFQSGSVVKWGSSTLSTQYINPTQLKAQVPASSIITAGTAVITVQTPAPGGGTSNSLFFEIDSGSSSSAPVFTSITATVNAGATATYPVTIPSSATKVSASCLNLPAGAACSYSSTSGAVTIATSSTTPKGTFQITVVFSETLPGAATSFILFPLLLTPLFYLRRRLGQSFWIVAGFAVVLLGAAMNISACGGGGGSPAATPPPNPTHQVTTSATVGLTVQ